MDSIDFPPYALIVFVKLGEKILISQGVNNAQHFIFEYSYINIYSWYYHCLDRKGEPRKVTITWPEYGGWESCADSDLFSSTVASFDLDVKILSSFGIHTHHNIRDFSRKRSLLQSGVSDFTVTRCCLRRSSFLRHFSSRRRFSSARQAPHDLGDVWLKIRRHD